MKKCINGEYIEITAEEFAEWEAEAILAEAEYWQTVNYDEAVNAKIREKYTESQEFAILRQRDDKLEEYSNYYTYCEECKAFVKAKKVQYGNTEIA